MLFIISRMMTCTQLALALSLSLALALACVFALGLLLPSPKEVIADPLPKYLLFVRRNSPVQLIQSP